MLFRRTRRIHILPRGTRSAAGERNADTGSEGGGAGTLSSSQAPPSGSECAGYGGNCDHSDFASAESRPPKKSTDEDHPLSSAEDASIDVLRQDESQLPDTHPLTHALARSSPDDAAQWKSSASPLTKFLLCTEKTEKGIEFPAQVEGCDHISSDVSLFACSRGLKGGAIDNLSLRVWAEFLDTVGGRTLIVGDEAERG